MDRKHIIEKIRLECEGSEGTDGFIVKLRNLEFCQEGYQNLLSALVEYREIMRGEKWMEREVACCLYFLETGLSDALAYFPDTDPQKKLVENALGEISPLIFDIFTDRR